MSLKSCQVLNQIVVIELSCNVNHIPFIFFEWKQLEAKWAKMETFNLNKELDQYDDNVVDWELGNLVEVSGPMVGAISTPPIGPTPYSYENIEA